MAQDQTLMLLGMRLSIVNRPCMEGVRGTLHGGSEEEEEEAGCSKVDSSRVLKRWIPRVSRPLCSQFNCVIKLLLIIA
jgi:hypothetical protein